MFSRILFFSLLTLIGLNTFAQSETKSFSLKEAINYAVNNNTNNLNARLDGTIAKAKKNEVRGIGFPQISGSFDVKDYVELPTQLLPGEFFGAPAGTYIPIKFGTRYNATGTIQATQILFNSDYIVALQASGTYLELSEKNISRTHIESIVAVSKAYYNVLINRERSKLVYANLTRLEKLKNDTKVLYENGFVEKIDLDRVEVAYNNLVSEKMNIERLTGVSESLLKFQMGISIQAPILLSDSLNPDDIPSIDILNTGKAFDYNLRIEYSLLQTQKRLNELELKKNRSKYLPNLTLYGNLSTQAQRNTFDFFDSNKRWYPIGLIGATLNIPLFDGLQKNYKIQQSKLLLEKTLNSLKGLENSINLEIDIARTNYLNALSSIETQKKNIELAKGVSKITKAKYEQGVGSNLEVITAEASLKEAQSNYYNALYDYLTAKIDYKKALGIIK